MKKIAFLAALFVTFAAMAQVKVTSYRQALAEDHAGIIDRKAGVVDAREEAISRCGYSPLGFTIINNVGFPSVDGGVKGLAINLLAGENHSVYALEFGGFANMVTYDFGGLQFALAYNGVGDTMSGLQVGGVNYAETISGAQVGLYNVTRGGKGFQVGVVNFANAMKGMQIGVFNINEAAQCPYLPIMNLAF